MRKMTYEQLQSHEVSRLVVAERFNRKTSIRRKPRSPEETRLLAEMVSDSVRKAKESGELVKYGQQFRIYVK